MILHALTDKTIAEKVYETLSSFLDDGLVNAMMTTGNRVIQSGHDDVKVIQSLKHVYKAEKLQLSSKFPEERLQRIINGLSIKPKTYLDFGSNTGINTSYIVNALNLKKTNSFGIDPVYNPKGEDYIPITYSLENRIPLPDDSIDLITCFMALHHTDNPIHYLKEMRRVLSENGELVIRETDLKSKELYYFNHIMERIYYQVMGDDLQNHAPEHFNSTLVWIEIFNKVGLKVSKVENPEPWNNFTPVHFYLRKN